MKIAKSNNNIGNMNNRVHNQPGLSERKHTIIYESPLFVNLSKYQLSHSGHIGNDNNNNEFGSIIVTGLVYAPYQVDTDGMAMDAVEIRKMAERFNLLVSNDGESGDIGSNRIDINHNGRVFGAKLTESFLAGPDSEYPDGSWVISVMTDDPQVKRDIVKGELNGFSLWGKGFAELKPVIMIHPVESQGTTEMSDEAGPLPSHNHELLIKYDQDGKILPGSTDLKFGHVHAVLGATATEKMFDHSHRIEIGPAEASDQLNLKKAAGFGFLEQPEISIRDIDIYFSTLDVGLSVYLLGDTESRYNKSIDAMSGFLGTILEDNDDELIGFMLRLTSTLLERSIRDQNTYIVTENIVNQNIGISIPSLFDMAAWLLFDMNNSLFNDYDQMVDEAVTVLIKAEGDMPYARDHKGRFNFKLDELDTSNLRDPSLVQRVDELRKRYLPIVRDMLPVMQNRLNDRFRIWLDTRQRYFDRSNGNLSNNISKKGIFPYSLLEIQQKLALVFSRISWVSILIDDFKQNNNIDFWLSMTDGFELLDSQSIDLRINGIEMFVNQTYGEPVQVAHSLGIKQEIKSGLFIKD